MGTIISDIKDDLQKLEELKQKIGEVKRELTSIDIRVEIDAKNDLEKKLQALNKEYEQVFRHSAELRAGLASDMKAISDSIDMEKPTEELRKFDDQLVKMCDNLGTYFDGLKGKLEAMLNVLGDGGTIAANIKTNDQNAAQLEDLKKQNADLIEQIRQRQDELEKEKQIYKQLADAVRTNNVSAIQQLQEATEAVDAKKIVKDIKETNIEIGKQEAIVKELEEAYAKAQAKVERLQKSLAAKENAYSGNSYMHLAEINAARAELEKATNTASRLQYQLGEAQYSQKELNNTLAEYERQLEEAGNKQDRIRTQIMNAREQMAKMIAAGLQGTEMFQNVAQEAAGLRKQMALANASMKYFADPNRHLTTLKVGLQGVAGAAGLVTGVMGLFNSENEKMAQIQTKVQSILAVIVGLETTYNLVKKTSNVMLAIEEVKTWAIAKAKGVQAAATGAATVAQEGLNAAMKANPIGAVVSLLAILGTAIYAVTKALFTESEAEKKAREEKEAHSKAIKEQHEQWAKSVAESAAKQLVSYRSLQDKWNELGNDLKAKEKFVKDNKTAFNDLGFAVDSVTDAENLLVNNTDAVVNAIMARAKAAAYQKVLEEQYEKEIRERIKSDSQSKSVANGGSRATVRVGDSAVKNTRAYYNAKEMGYQFEKGDTEAGKWTEQGKKRIDEYNKKYQEAQRKAFEEREKTRREISQKEINSIQTLAKKELDAEKKAAEQTGVKQFKGGKDTTKEDADAARKAAEEAKRRAEEEQKMAELLDSQKREEARKAEDLQFSTREAEIKAMQEGTDKTIKQLELDRDRELAAIRRSYEEMRIARVEAAKKLWEADTKNKGKNFYSSTQYKNASVYTKEEKDNRLARETAVNVNFAQEEQRRIEQLIASHQSYVDKKLAIDKKYEEDVAKIDAAIASAEEKGQKDVVEALKRTRAEAEKDRAKSQADLSLQQLKEMPEYIRAFEDLDNTSTETLEHLIKLFEDSKEAAAASLSPDQLREYTNTIQQMQDKINERDPFKALVTSTKNVKKAEQDLARAERDLDRVRNHIPVVVGLETDANGELVEVLLTEAEAEEEVRKQKDKLKKAQKSEKKAWAEVRSEVDELANSINNLGSAIGGEAGQILQIAASVITFTTQTIDTVKRISESMKAVALEGKATMDALQTSNAILALIGAAYSIFQGISSLFGESEEEKQARLKREEMMRNMTSSVEQYRLEVIKARQEEEAWFASSSIMKLAQQWELSSEAQKSYYAIAKQQTEQMIKDIAHWQNGTIALGAVWAERGKFFQDYTASIKDAGNAFDMLIKNERDELETLSSFIQRVYGTEMFDAFGNLNTTVIDTFLADFSDRIQHDDEQILKNLNEMAKQYQEWQKALQEYVDEQYGGLSDNIVDALWAWYDDGTDVLSAFRDNARDTFRGVASDMLKEFVNSLVFDQLKEKLTGLYTAYSENVNKNGMSVADALKLLAEGTEEALTDFESTVSQQLPTLTELTTKIGEMSDRLFGDGKSDAADYFDDIRSAWVDAVTGMKGDTADFGKEIARIMFESLVSSNIFNKEFDTWLKEWTAKYEEAMKVSAPGEREARLAQLQEERANKMKELTEKTKEYADMAGYAAEADEELTTSLSNLRDTITDSLLSLEDDAGDIGKKVGSNLIREMLQQMLDSETYAGRMAEIKEHWQKALNGEDGYTYESVMAEIAALNNDIANDEAIGKLAELWKALNASVDDSSSSFGDLRSTFMDAITDMEKGADNFKKKLNETLTKDLIEKKVFEVPITMTIDGEDKTFNTFDEYVEDWTKRYLKALEEGDEQILSTLVKEMEEREEAMAKSAEDYAKRLQDAAKDTTFTGMESNFVSALMDMEGSVEDFANDMKKTIVQKLVESFMVSEKIKPLLNELQETFDYAMGLDVDTNERARIIAEGYKDAAGVVHKGINDISGVMDPLKETIDGVLTSIGYVSDKAKQDAEDAAKEVEDMLASLGDSLVTHLTTSGATAEDFTDNIIKEIAKEMVEAYVATNELSKKLADLKDKLKAAFESGNETLIADARKELTDFVSGVADDLKSITSVFDELESDTTFSGMSDSFVASLMDMSRSAEDWAQDIGQTIAQKIIEQMIVPTMIQPLLDNLQSVFKSAMASGTSVNDKGETVYDWRKVLGSESLGNALSDMKAQYPEIQKIVKDIMDMLGLETSGENPFSDMRDNFVSSLTDMEADAESFARDITRMLTEQMIDKVISDGFQDQINALGLQWSQALEKGDTAAIEVITQKLAALRDEMGKAVEPLLDSIKEINRQTDTTFSNMTDSWVSALMDMEGTAEQFAENVGKTMAQQIITRMVAPVYIQPVLDRLQEAFDTAIAVEGATIQSVIRTLSPFMDEIEEVYNQIVPMRDEIYRGLDIYTYTVEETVDEVQYALNDMKSNFTSALMDMTSTADDFSKDISKTLAQNFIENFVLGEKFNQQMEYWQRQYENIISSGMSEDQRKKQLTQLRDTIAAAKEGYVEEARAIQELLGVGTSRDDKSAKVNLADKMTYDQGDEAVGILRAIQIATEQIKERMPGGGIPLTSATNADLTLSGTDIKDIAGDMRDIIARSYLELIEIRENTGAIVLPIKTMQGDIAEMKRDIHERL